MKPRPAKTGSSPRHCSRSAALVGLLSIAFATPVRADCPPVFVTGWGGTGAGPGMFSRPWGIAVDRNSDVYVADFGNNRIQKFDANGQFLLQWGGFGSGHGQFDAPITLSADDRGFVFVIDTGNARVQKFTASGEFVAAWGTSGSAPGQFQAPRGIVADGRGHVYVADTGNDRIQKFTDTGTLMGVWPVGAAPFDIAVNGSGDLFVVYHDEAFVRCYNSGGQFLFQWGLAGSSCDRMAQPFALSLDPEGNVHVVDAELNRIQKFTSIGRILALRGIWGTGPGNFKHPRGIAVDHQGMVYVADTFGDRIQKFSPGADSCMTCAPAGPQPSSAPRILLHVRAATTKNACASGGIADCADAVTSGGLSTASGPFHFAYLVAVRNQVMEDIAGLQCGIAYESGKESDLGNASGIDIFGWTLCATLQFPSPPGGPAWPAPGSGNQITWDPDGVCQTTTTAVAGYFYLGAYTTDRLRLTPRPVDQAAKLANCDGAEFRVERLALGYAVFSEGGRSLGCNPCQGPCDAPIPVERTTWSSIKALFGP